MNTELRSVSSPPHLTPHLTEAQFGELLAGPVRKDDFALTPAEAHVLACEQCAAELAGLHESLTLFRQAATAYTVAELRRIPPVVLPALPMVSPALRSMVLATAAALVFAAFVPMQMLHQRSQRASQQAASADTADIQHYATESNEALLDDVSRATSASVPDAMQSLADPAATNDLSVRKSN